MSRRAGSKVTTKATSTKKAELKDEPTKKTYINRVKKELCCAKNKEGFCPNESITSVRKEYYRVNAKKDRNISERVYCKKHKNMIVKIMAKKQSIKVCMSKYECFPHNRGYRCRLPNESKEKMCAVCKPQYQAELKNLNEQRKAMTTIIRDKNLHLNQIGNNKFRYCTECNKNKKDILECIKCNITNMGVKNTGEMVDKCEKHFKSQQVSSKKKDELVKKDPVRALKRKGSMKAYDNRTSIKEKKREYKQKPEVKIRTANSSRTSRLKFRTEDSEKYLKKNADYQKNFRLKNKIKTPSILNNKQKFCTVRNYYIINANKKKLKFNLNENYVGWLITQECYYCEIKSDKLYNGIDRICSKEDYTKDNCVTACSMCNIMKNTTNISTFILRIITIAHVWSDCKLFESYLHLLPVDGIKRSYKNFVDNAKYEFKLTKNEVDEIIYKPCHYCNGVAPEGRHLGIDRINSNGIYEINNVVSCCSQCNYVKNDYNVDDFYEKCLTIAQIFWPSSALTEFIKTHTFTRCLEKNLKKPTKEELEIMKKERKEKREKQTQDNNTVTAHAMKMINAAKMNNCDINNIIKVNNTNLSEGTLAVYAEIRSIIAEQSNK
jgi:hypothetical protein